MELRVDGHFLATVLSVPRTTYHMKPVRYLFWLYAKKQLKIKIHSTKTNW